MLAPKISFRAPIQPADLAFDVNSEVIYYIAHIGIAVKLKIVSWERFPNASLYT